MSTTRAQHTALSSALVLAVLCSGCPLETARVEAAPPHGPPAGQRASFEFRAGELDTPVVDPLLDPQAPQPDSVLRRED